MKRPNALPFIIPAALFAGLLCYAVFNALAIYIPQRRELQNFEELKEIIETSAQEPEERERADGADNPNPTDPYGALRERNADFAGWLNIEDSGIDYPVMKAPESDPEYYLHRDFDGNPSFSGCLFIGGGCDENSDCFIIYGHKMNNNSMFGALDSYADYDYAERHSEIRFYVAEEERVYKVFAAFRTKIFQDRTEAFQYYESAGALEEADYLRTVESVRALSIPRLPDAPTYPAQLLFLSTCSYHTEDGRFVVAAYRRES